MVWCLGIRIFTDCSDIVTEVETSPQFAEDVENPMYQYRQTCMSTKILYLSVINKLALRAVFILDINN